MSHKNETSRALTYPLRLPGAWDTATLTGATTLTKKSGQYQKLDPGGAHRDVTLPTVQASEEGYFFFIANSADQAENLVVKDAAGATIGTVNQSEEGEFYVDSSGAWILHGIRTYAAT